MNLPGLESIGRWLMIAGLGLALMGSALWLIGRVLPNGAKDLPGTIRIEGSGFTCVFPLLASIVLSILLTIILNVLARFFNR
jgi:hypothetical protein